MKIVVNLLNGHKAEFDAANIKIDKVNGNIVITEVPSAKVSSLAAAVKAATEDVDVASVVKLLKISDQQFNDIINALEMHAETGIITAQKYRREHFVENLIMTMFAVRGFTACEAKKMLKKHNLSTVKLNNDHYSRLINGDKGWEVVKELLHIHVEPRIIDRDAVKKALESGLSYKEVRRMFGIGLSLLYEIKNGRKYTPRL